MDQVTEILDAMYTDPLEPDDDLTWTFANGTASDIEGICYSFIDDVQGDIL